MTSQAEIHVEQVNVVIQPQTQTQAYWVSKFAVTEADIEQIYNHFIEVEKPQTASQLARVILHFRLMEEKNEIKQRLSGRDLYQPRKSYAVGDELVFPAMQFAYGKVVSTRPGANPQEGQFDVIAVEINGKVREFAAGLQSDHPLNKENGNLFAGFDLATVEELHRQYGGLVAKKLTELLGKQEGFVRLGQQWFVRGLMAEISIGHLHLAEAVLDMNGGGPLAADEIMVDLDLDPGVDIEVRRFSLNHALLNDSRFDEVAPQGKVVWYLRRLEPEGVRERPPRLAYTSIPHDRALLSPQLQNLERELDDEWSDLPPQTVAQPVVLTLTYPHRYSGTLPLSARTRPLFPPSNSPRQLVTFIDEVTSEEIAAWVVQHDRYIYGLKDWYEANGVPIGGFINLRPGPEPGVILLGCDRRRGQREWVRLATVIEGQIKFELHRRTISCGFDDLMIVGTDFVTAVDVVWRRAETNKRPIASLLAEIFPELAALNPQVTVHAKTLYSAINMFRRVPPGPLFAELVRQPAFQQVGDHYWQFDSSRWNG